MLNCIFFSPSFLRYDHGGEFRIKPGPRKCEWFYSFFPEKIHTHDCIWTHGNIEVCVCVCKRKRLCMFIGLVVHVIICVWSGWCFFVFTWSFFDSIWLDISKTWTWMWSRRLPAHTAAAEQLQRLALKAAASLLPYDYHDMCHQDNESWTEFISDI